jgi:hypothetical protein
VVVKQNPSRSRIRKRLREGEVKCGRKKFQNENRKTRSDNEV